MDAAVTFLSLSCPHAQLHPACSSRNVADIAVGRRHDDLGGRGEADLALRALLTALARRVRLLLTPVSSLDAALDCWGFLLTVLGISLLPFTVKLAECGRCFTRALIIECGATKMKTADQDGSLISGSPERPLLHNACKCWILGSSSRTAGCGGASITSHTSP